MCQQDRQPLPNSAGIERIVPTANDRLGAVLSALYSFWIARQAAVDRNTQVGGGRRDAYSLIFFNHEPSTSIENDFTSSPDELLTSALQFEADGGTDFTSALESAQNVMTSQWSTERYGSFPTQKFDAILNRQANMHRRTPVMIFLSDGEDYVRDEAIYDVCRDAVRQGFVDFHPKRYLPERLTTQTLGGRFRSTRSLSDRMLRHLRCVGWRRSLWKCRTTRRTILCSLPGLTFHRLIRRLSTR